MSKEARFFIVSLDQGNLICGDREINVEIGGIVHQWRLIHGGKSDPRTGIPQPDAYLSLMSILVAIDSEGYLYPTTESGYPVMTITPVHYTDYKGFPTLVEKMNPRDQQQLLEWLFNYAPKNPEFCSNCHRECTYHTVDCQSQGGPDTLLVSSCCNAVKDNQ